MLVGRSVISVVEVVVHSVVVVVVVVDSWVTVLLKKKFNVSNGIRAKLGLTKAYLGRVEVLDALGWTTSTVGVSLELLGRSVVLPRMLLTVCKLVGLV